MVANGRMVESLLVCVVPQSQKDVAPFCLHFQHQAMMSTNPLEADVEGSSLM